MQHVWALLAAAMLCWGAGPAFGQEAFPARPIRMIVVYPPGGGADVLARTLGDAITRHAGQPVVIENRAGAGGMIGTTACKGAAPDGYTYCLLLSDLVTIYPHIFKKIQYDAEKDLAPVAAVADGAVTIVVNSSLPVRNLAELAAYSQRERSNWGSFGIGSSSHLVLAQFNKSLNASMAHVPYQGAPQLLVALTNKEIDATFALYGLVSQQIERGQFRPVAVMGTRRLAQLPEVPTLIEQGVNFSPVIWYGVFAPAGTPAHLVQGMNRLVNAGLSDRAVMKTLETQGFLSAADTPQAFGERVARDRRSWGPIARSLQLNLD